MRNVKFLRHALHSGLLALTAVPASGATDRLNFQIAFGDVPGLEEIEAGHYDAAIDILTSRRADDTRPLLDDELSTLCAAYIMARRFREATPVCDDAVAVHDSDAAYNNRGVVRAYTGDVDGALRDFSRVRVRPEQVPAYVERIKRMNPRLMASNNFEVVEVVKKARSGERDDDELSLAVPGADVEELVE